MIAIRKMQPL